MVDVLDIKNLPLIGEYVFIKNTNTGNIEKLRVAAYKKCSLFNNTKEVVYVGFSSLNEEENIHSWQNEKISCISTYVEGGVLPKMKGKFLFGGVSLSANKKTYATLFKEEAQC